MKHLILSFLLCLPLFSFAQTNQDCKMTFKNNTNKEIALAYVYFNQAEQAWVSEGWYKIERYSNKVVPFTNCAGASIYVYAYQKGAGGKTWGDGDDFCIDPKNDFRIINANQVKCKTRKNFTAVKINVGENTYIFNP